MTVVPSSPIVLALDACTEACSVALWLEGRVLQQFEVTPRGHAQRLLPMVDVLLHEAGLERSAIDLIACGRGPGAFTGVRISLAVAQGLALALDVPVAAMSTLAVLAEGTHRRLGTTSVATALDARMGEVYWGAFRRDEATQSMVAEIEESVCAPGSVSLPPHWCDYAAAGSGWGVHRDALIGALPTMPGTVDEQALPEAQDMLRPALAMLRAGDVCAAEALAPVYLRDRVTHQQGS
ncbi:tRNA threonylcarbamoyladenosine biosynthesis protein TsaB [Natronocella acetinitrilica]|uniref:tRNA threonylcarbamoyladenosine biosynthesis protein TsaB n=1 Tax=Natronocella acetinitrilica TaxID=414046 RepID=A0AAE3G5T9_9GAMM|nr:tRNA (adenosine(37)-N6)-threonylcarbamoyltransferase complex dimerization subunit type 1 TsaB [Natronocella acetinitrilica]MCP1674953.1 tRNA threonylcarbamoyladenosine biosynthesis protein TsaB [Natronocella acetinitrilica]